MHNDIEPCKTAGSFPPRYFPSGPKKPEPISILLEEMEAKLIHEVLCMRANALNAALPDVMDATEENFRQAAQVMILDNLAARFRHTFGIKT